MTMTNKELNDFLQEPKEIFMHEKIVYLAYNNEKIADIKYLLESLKDVFSNGGIIHITQNGKFKLDISLLNSTGTIATLNAISRSNLTYDNLLVYADKDESIELNFFFYNLPHDILFNGETHKKYDILKIPVEGKFIVESPDERRISKDPIINAIKPEFYENLKKEEPYKKDSEQF